MKQRIRRLLEKRVYVFGAVLLAMLFVLVRRFFYLQVLDGRQYQETFQSMVERQEIYTGSRGIIYDRNEKKLAYNELSYNITIEDKGAYENRRSWNQALNRIIRESIELIEKNGDTAIGSLAITLNDSEEYEFTVEGTRRQRFLADV